MEIKYKDKECMVFRTIFNDNYINIHLYSYRNPELGIILRKNKIAELYITYTLKNKKLEYNHCRPVNIIGDIDKCIEEQKQKYVYNYLIKIDVANIMMELQKKYFGL